MSIRPTLVDLVKFPGKTAAVPNAHSIYFAAAACHRSGPHHCPCRCDETSDMARRSKERSDLFAENLTLFTLTVCVRLSHCVQTVRRWAGAALVTRGRQLAHRRAPHPSTTLNRLAVRAATTAFPTCSASTCRNRQGVATSGPGETGVSGLKDDEPVGEDLIPRWSFVGVKVRRSRDTLVIIDRSFRYR